MPAHRRSDGLFAVIAALAVTVAVVGFGAQTPFALMRVPIGLDSVTVGSVPKPADVRVEAGPAIAAASTTVDSVSRSERTDDGDVIRIGAVIVVVVDAAVPSGSTGTVVAVDDANEPQWVQVVTGDGSIDWMPVESAMVV
jgi:hypothetical protein